MVGTPKVKPGWKTTEFWVSIVAQITTVLVLIGVLNQGDSTSLNASIAESIEAVGIVIVNALVVLGYIKSRTEVKKNGG